MRVGVTVEAAVGVGTWGWSASWIVSGNGNGSGIRGGSMSVREVGLGVRVGASVAVCLRLGGGVRVGV